MNEGVGNQFNPGPHHARVGHSVPPALRPRRVGYHLNDFIAVFFRARAVEQLGAELVEPMSKPIVARRIQKQVSPHFNHFHATPQSNGKIKDVFECATVINHIEAPFPFRRNGQVKVVHHRSAFISRGVQGLHACGAEGAEEVFGLSARGPAAAELLIRQAVRLQQLLDLVGENIQYQSADREDVAELHALLASAQKKLHAVEIKSHIRKALDQPASINLSCEQIYTFLCMVAASAHVDNPLLRCYSPVHPRPRVGVPGLVCQWNYYFLKASRDRLSDGCGCAG
ncbi:hypothetical protein SBV1_110029 [Verrucomicrobia bacterium]|nr:hypothetical protein SBV1_110029 [Verrucomicrobiota bacterium]